MNLVCSSIVNIISCPGLLARVTTYVDSNIYRERYKLLHYAEECYPGPESV